MPYIFFLRRETSFVVCDLDPIWCTSVLCIIYWLVIIFWFSKWITISGEMYHIFFLKGETSISVCTGNLFRSKWLHISGDTEGAFPQLEVLPSLPFSPFPHPRRKKHTNRTFSVIIFKFLPPWFPQPQNPKNKQTNKQTNKNKKQKQNKTKQNKTPLVPLMHINGWIRDPWEWALLWKYNAHWLNDGWIGVVWYCSNINVWEEIPKKIKQFK